ncbi:MAG: FAD-binding oxidoreductase [Halioglobus sp.]
MTASNDHTITCRFSDGIEHLLKVPQGTEVLHAALASNVPILHQCQSGSCGSCIGKVVNGDLQMRKDTASSLLKDEQEQGLRLMCSSLAYSDSTVEFEYPSTLFAPRQVSAFVNSIEWIATDAVRLKLELAEGDWVDFSPGQFVRMEIPGSGQWRSYSMATSPEQIPKLDFLIRTLPDGVMSNYLRDKAAIDDVIKLEGSFGSFFLREQRAASNIMIAGGTGLAPMLSMLDVIRQRSGRKPRTLLSFGCMNEDALFALEDLDLRQYWMKELEVRISLDQGCPTGQYRSGNPVEAITREDVGSDTIAYLCGPPGMVKAAFGHLQSLGVELANIHAEQFVPSE